MLENTGVTLEYAGKISGIIFVCCRQAFNLRMGIVRRTTEKRERNFIQV